MERLCLILVGMMVACGAGDGSDVRADVVTDLAGNQDVFAAGEVMADVPAEVDVVELAAVDPHPNDDVLRLNQIQCKGTHNSYHLLPDEAVAPDWEYEHAPLDVQLEAYGVRQVELDIHWHEEDGDFHVYHVPILDDNSSCETLAECLGLLKGWSDAHPQHQTLFVFIEPKDDLDTHSIVGHYDDLDALLLSVFPREQVITPADVAGEHANMQEALAAVGWPTLRECRGKVLFHMLDSGLHRDNYLGPDVTLAERVMHVRGGPETTWGSFVEVGNAMGSEEKIIGLAQANYMVRSTADDTNPDKADKNPARAAAALVASHVISTDYPVPTNDGSYFFEIPGGTPSRCHPVTAPEWCLPKDVE